LNVNFTPEAIHDLESIHNHISSQDRRAADRVLSRIRQTVVIFEAFPLLGRQGSVPETREFAISGLPYTIVYRIASTTEIDILTIVHQRKLYPPSTDV
jgi:toxin ParE1/3/4